MRLKNVLIVVVATIAAIQEGYLVIRNVME